MAPGWLKQKPAGFRFTFQGVRSWYENPYGLNRGAISGQYKLPKANDCRTNPTPEIKQVSNSRGDDLQKRDRHHESAAPFFDDRPQSLNDFVLPIPR